MTEARSNAQDLRMPFILGITLAVLGAVWSVARHDGCDSCNSAAMLVGDLNLGLLGLVFYAGLLGLSCWLLRRPAVERGFALPKGLTLPVLLATGVHLTLVTLLAKNRLLCPSCLLTATGAFLTATVVVRSHAWKPHWMLAVVMATAGLTFAALKSRKGNANQVALHQGYLAQQLLLRDAHPAAGTARLVVFVRPTCHVCKRFTAQVLTPLRKQYSSDQLVIEERPAWQGMATPTTVVLGHQSALLVGFRDLAALRGAVDAARGTSRAQQAAVP